MSDDLLGPAGQATRIWSDTLRLLKQNPTLSPRDKSWLEGVVPEAVYGTTIVLCVSNMATQQALQNELNAPLLNALKIISGNDMFPAFKIVAPQVSQPEPQPPEYRHPDTAAKPSEPFPANPSPTVADLAQESYMPNSMQSISSIDSISAEMTEANQQPGATAPRIPGEPSFPVRQQKVMRDPETHLNKNSTFDTFVPGDSNRFARTVALAVAEGTGQEFNPLCIYGGSGLGKTHLLNAIGNYALVKDPTLKVRYVNSEEFTNEFIEALQARPRARTVSPNSTADTARSTCCSSTTSSSSAARKRPSNSSSTRSTRCIRPTSVSSSRPMSRPRTSRASRHDSSRVSTPDSPSMSSRLILRPASLFCA